MKIIHYQMYPAGVMLHLSNGGSIFIHFNEWSGKVYYRYKIDTLLNIKHPGIYLGQDSCGVGYFLHNHYHFGSAHLATQPEFTQGMDLYEYGAACSNKPLDVVRKGIELSILGEPYKVKENNCQTFTNTACHNRRESEDVKKWLPLGLLAIIGIGLIASVTSRG